MKRANEAKLIKIGKKEIYFNILSTYIEKKILTKKQLIIT